MGVDQGPVEVTDLKVHVEVHTVVVPSEPTPHECLFLSNIDQVVVYPIDTIYFFPTRDIESTVCVVERLRHALEKLLVPYYFMAGRLKMNMDQCRLELDCNNAGVLFAGASSELTMDELGDIRGLNPAFKSLVLQVEGAKTLAELPLTMVQVTRFKCGGFTLGLSTNHTLLDGIAAGEFLSNYASVARGDGLAVLPKPDRTALRARAPPHVNYEHNEYVWLSGLHFLKEPMISDAERNAVAAATSRGYYALQEHAFKVFRVPGQILARLKELAKSPDLPGDSCTAFEALAAHFWRCRTAAVETDPSQFSSMLFAVDFRNKMQPPLPQGFAGNAVMSACARAVAGELVEKPLSFAVQKVKEARARISADYVQSAIDCLEIHRSAGVPLGTAGCYVSAWWKIPFFSLDFGWGKPIYAGPVLTPDRVEFVLFISDGTPHGLSVLLAMPVQHLPKFEQLFLIDP